LTNFPTFNQDTTGTAAHASALAATPAVCPGGEFAAGVLATGDATGCASPPSAPVSSVFGRVGAVTAQAGDYSFAQLSGVLAANQLPLSFTAPLATACAS